MLLVESSDVTPAWPLAKVDDIQAAFCHGQKNWPSAVYVITASKRQGSSHE